MSQANGSSATIKSNETIGLQAAAVAGGWREGILVLVMVLAPIGLTIILVAIGVLAIAGWQIVRGVAVELPTRANIQPYGLLAYAAASWSNARGSNRGNHVALGLKRTSTSARHSTGFMSTRPSTAARAQFFRSCRP
jgi:hypothetical protein